MTNSKESKQVWPFSDIGARAIDWVQELGAVGIFLLKAFFLIFRPKQLPSIVQHIYYIGARSAPVVMLVGLFTGMVLGLQLYYTLVQFGSTGVLGSAISLSLIRELGPVLRTALGQPHLPRHLRQQIKQTIENQDNRFRLVFGIPVRLLNAAGTVVVIAVLAIGAYAVIQGQVVEPSDPVSVSFQTSGNEATPTAEPTPIQSPLVGTSLGDRLPQMATK